MGNALNLDRWSLEVLTDNHYNWVSIEKLTAIRQKENFEMMPIMNRGIACDFKHSYHLIAAIDSEVLGV